MRKLYDSIHSEVIVEAWASSVTILSKAKYNTGKIALPALCSNVRAVLLSNKNSLERSLAESSRNVLGSVHTVAGERYMLQMVAPKCKDLFWLMPLQSAHDAACAAAPRPKAAAAAAAAPKPSPKMILKFVESDGFMVPVLVNSRVVQLNDALEVARTPIAVPKAKAGTKRKI